MTLAAQFKLTPQMRSMLARANKGNFPINAKLRPARAGQRQTLRVLRARGYIRGRTVTVDGRIALLLATKRDLARAHDERA